MFRLLKKLFSTEDGEVSVVVVNDDGSKPSSSYRLHPVNLWLLTIGSLLLIIVTVVVLVRFTPVGGLIYNQEKTRESVIEIQQQVAAMQDTLRARNLQLRQMEQVIGSGKDTTYKISASGTSKSASVLPPQTKFGSRMREPVEQLQAGRILIKNLLEDASDFPAPYPIEGSPTRRFNADNGHFGLDIAATSGAAFKALADGVIVSELWTFNYGYVILLQHGGDIITVYKHAQTLAKPIGAPVRQGDILGTIGNVGVLSSGPHLHMEIWQNGIPQDPLNYLIKS